jgi:hypothetical protein
MGYGTCVPLQENVANRWFAMIIGVLSEEAGAGALRCERYSTTSTAW